MELSANLSWAIVLSASIVLDTLATAYLKVASDRLDGSGFFLASVLAVVAYAPSIILLGYALKIGPSYLASVGLWFVGAYVANAVAGVMAFNDPFTMKTAVGIATACVAVVLLTP
jgi:multidrug transporter EmrE-like cation transporter